jgi:hypothetical protein
MLQMTRKRPWMYNMFNAQAAMTAPQNPTDT